MSAAQEVGFMRPEYHIDLDIRVPRLRPPPTNFFVYAECEDPYPTTPPGVLTMDDDDCGIRTVPPDPADEAAALAAEPNAFPPTERPTRPETMRPAALSSLPAASSGDSYFAAASRDFARAIDEMRLTRQEIARGFRDQSADLALIRHELQGYALRLTKLEGLRDELRLVKEELRGALSRIEDLERRIPHDSAPPSATSR